MKKNKKEIKKQNKKISKTDFIIFTIVFVIFSIVLLSFFPGILTGDCVDQINQAENNIYYNAHPIIHSFIIGNLTKLGGIWVPALFQILVFASLWTYICHILRKYNDSNKNKIFQIILTIIISIMPLNFLYSITLWKDILYSYAFLLLLILMYIGIKESYKYTTPQMILLSLSCIVIMKFRHNGLPIGILMFSIILILNAIKVKKIKTTFKFLSIFICLYIIILLPEKIVKNSDNSISVKGAFTSTEIYCMGGLLNSDIDFEENDLKFLNKILNIQEWKELYIPYTGSPILFNKNYNSKLLEKEENKRKFDDIFLKYAKQKPKVILNHFLSVNSIWWSIPEKYGMHSVVLTNDWISEMCDGKYDNRPILKQGNEKFTQYVVNTMKNKYVYEFNYRPALAILLTLIAIVIVCLKEKKLSYLLLMLPMLLNIGTYIFLIASQDQRYFYPSYMTEYISILILITVLTKKNEKNLVKKKHPIKNKKNIKTLVIIPAYNEEKAISNVINSVYNQNIKNCDVLVINDGSIDTTLQKAKETKAIVIDEPNNLGIGGAVQTGYLYAQKHNYDIAIQLDGDGQHNPKYIKELIKEILNGNDLVIGSRFIQNSHYNQTFLRMFGIKVISFIIHCMTHVKIYDTTSGYRAINKNIIDEFVANYPYDYPEPCTNMNMIKKGYKIKEIPVEMEQRETGVSSISPLKSVTYMFKVILYILLMGLKD